MSRTISSRRQRSSTASTSPPATPTAMPKARPSSTSASSTATRHCAMPVRSSSSHVLTWPPRDAVDEAARAWGAALKASRSDVVRVGYFGSYARGDWGVGSDLCLLYTSDAADDLLCVDL